MNNLIPIHFFIKLLNKMANSFFPQWDFFYGTEEVTSSISNDKPGCKTNDSFYETVFSVTSVDYLSIPCLNIKSAKNEVK